MEELLDVYTKEGKYLGVRSRKDFQKDYPGIYHKPAWTWVYNSKGEILIQKRASSKKMYPNRWDMSCAGHVDAGETPVQGAIREAKEEIGIDVTEDECKFIFEYVEDRCGELGQVFFIRQDKEIDEFSIDKEEVAKIKWVSIEEFKDIFYSDKWVPCNNDYKDRIVEEFKKLFEKGE